MKYRIGKLPPQAVHALAGQQQFEAIGGRIVVTDPGARLDRGDDQPVVDQLDLDDMGSLAEGRGDRRLVAALEPVGQIARRFVPQPRRCRGERRRRVDHRRQRPVRHRDPLGGVTRLVAGVGNNERHGVADMTNPVLRQGPARRHDHRRDGRHLGDARQRPDAVRLEIGSGKDAAHPRHRAGGRGIDPLDRSMSVRRAQHNAVQLTGQVYVIDIMPLPGQKPRVFETAQRTPDMAPIHPPVLKPGVGHYDAVSHV